MSRIANKPVDIPDNVEANINNNLLTVKGPLGEMKLDIHGDVDVQINDNIISVNSNQNSAMAGTMRSLICNNVVGVSKGFEKNLVQVQEIEFQNTVGETSVIQFMIQPVMVFGNYKGRIALGEKKADLKLVSQEKELESIKEE